MGTSLLELDPSEGIAIFTDGSSYYKDRTGGWAWIAIDAFTGECNGIGGEGDTTNNRMEMTAWIKGLEAVFESHGPCTIIVYSDSEYVGLGAMDRNRKRNNNRDLWWDLDEAIDKHKYVEFRHVKGHSGHEYNEAVDKLASQARHAFNYNGGD